MDQKLKGTIAIVTGASSGIGAATARMLAKNGASVAVLARRKDRLDALVAEIEGSGGSALAVQCDIGDTWPNCRPLRISCAWRCDGRWTSRSPEISRNT